MLQEAVLIASGPSPSSATTIHSLSNSSTTPLLTLKQTSTGPHQLSFVETSDGEGGVILGAMGDKALCGVWSFQKDQIMQKMVLPEKLSCIALDRSGIWCAAGTPTGRVYLWELASGILFNSFQAHYRHVTNVKFTDDQSALITTSQDSGIHVWHLSRLIDETMQKEPPTPWCSFTDHTLAVTDIQVGIGGLSSARLLSSSMDRRCKVWDLATQSILATFMFPSPLVHVTWDPAERFYFAGSEKAIYRVNLIRKRVDAFGMNSAEAIGGAGEVIRVSDKDEATGANRLIELEESLTALSLSLTATYLLAGFLSGSVGVYDTQSHQLLRSITSPLHKGAPITFVGALLKPPDILGTVNRGADDWLVRAVKPFQRVKGGKERESHVVDVLLKGTPENHWSLTREAVLEMVKDEQAYFLSPSSSSLTPRGEAATNATGTGASDANKVEELEKEVASLKAQLNRAKQINDGMWGVLVEKSGTGKNVNSVDGDVVMDGTGSRKKQKS